MTAKQTFLYTSLALSGLAIWAYLLTQVMPDPKNAKVIGLFLLSLLVWVSAGLAMLLFNYKIRKGNREVIYAHLTPSIRQGVIIAGTIVLLLVLQLLRVASWWEMLLVIIGASLFEIALRGQPQGKLK